MQSGRIRLAWRASKPIIGMVHLLPLPGSPGFRGSMDQVLERAIDDARALAEGGVDGIMVENYGDAPFFAEVVPPVTVSALTRAVVEVRRSTELPVGVNVLRNDAAAALSIAASTGAQLVRVNVHSGAMITDQGWITGKAADTLRLRRTLDAPVAIFADVLVKHAVPPAGLSVEAAARDTWERGAADALIVSGMATGAPTDVTEVRRIRAAVPDAPVWVGSGVTPDNVVDLLESADGLIVGSAFEAGGRAGAPVEMQRVRQLIGIAGKAHS